MKKHFRLLLFSAQGFLMVCGLLWAGMAQAVPVSQSRIAVNVDWCSAAISGTGGGSGTISLACVGAGTVQSAFLYWHGIGNPFYDNANIEVDGFPVAGTNIGDATTNCWGTGSSRAFEADVTALVPGDGNYAITNLVTGAGASSSNGVSLVVIYDDGDNTNNRDLVFFTGNDSNVAGGFPGEDDGWHASLPGINYGGGAVGAQVHVGDGQAFGPTDGDLEFSTINAPPLRFFDDAAHYDGNSVATAGTSRAQNGALWDVHSFDTTAAFGGVSGLVTLDVDGLGFTSPLPGSASTNDCLSLVVMLLDLEPFSAPNEISLDPQEALNCTGTEHTVTATIEDTDGVPQAGETVTFLVTSGPNIGATDTSATDASGMTDFSYTDTGLVAGTDTIEACFVGADGSENCANATKEWEVCNEPPDCTAAVADTLECIWPPNHGFVDVNIIGVTDPDGDAISIEITGVTSDEATASERGAGGATHAPDAVGIGTDTAMVRAERSGRNDGRVYEISFTADDGNGGQCSGTVQVGVPHDTRKKTCNAVDSGQDYDATQ